MKVSLALVLTSLIATVVVEADTCSSSNMNDAGEYVYTVKLDNYAGELGYYYFEECGTDVNPTIEMKMGETYRFIQADISNWYHPLGFAYEADGAHAGVDELEPTIVPVGANSTCGDDASCPAPMYFKNNTYVGTYSNIASVASVTTGEDNFGLDDYEPLFFHPLGDWIGYGEFSIALKFPEYSEFKQDIFYFCHIHQYVSGRIKLVDTNGNKISATDTPALKTGYYDVIEGHDEDCGTFGINDYMLPHVECPKKFVCGYEDASTEFKNFAKCIESMDCHQMAKMTTESTPKDEKALFVYQMIPHHQNAVNMAKALLKTGKLDCDDVTDEDNADCALKAIALEIAAVQNFQIQGMRGYLETNSHNDTDDCEVIVSEDASSPAFRVLSAIRTGLLSLFFLA